MNRTFRKAANRCCPVKAAPFDAEKIPDPDTLLAEFHRLKDRRSEGFDVTAVLFTPAALILSFGYFAWLRKLPVPKGCILYLVFLCVLLFFYGTMVVVSASQSLLPPLSREVKDALTAYGKDRERQKKEERELAEQMRLEQERSALLAEQEAQKAAAEAKRVKEAMETYLKAIAQDPIDEGLLRQAAEMGSAEARKRIGHLVLERMASSMYTESEKMEYAKNAEPHLKAAADSADGELKYLWYYTRSVFEKNNVGNWQKLLDDLRALMASGTLPAQYESHCTTLIQELVLTIDSMKKKQAQRDVRCNSADKPLSHQEKWDYIRDKCHCMCSPAAIQTIENDANLTAAQKEDLKDFLKIYGD